MATQYQHIFKHEEYGDFEMSPKLGSWDDAIDYLEHNASLWQKAQYGYMLTLAHYNNRLTFENFDFNIEAIEHRRMLKKAYGKDIFNTKKQWY